MRGRLSASDVTRLNAEIFARGVRCAARWAVLYVVTYFSFGIVILGHAVPSMPVQHGLALLGRHFVVALVPECLGSLAATLVLTTVFSLAYSRGEFAERSTAAVAVIVAFVRRLARDCPAPVELAVTFADAPERRRRDQSARPILDQLRCALLVAPDAPPLPPLAPAPRFLCGAAVPIEAAEERVAA